MSKHREYKGFILFLENGNKDGCYFVSIYKKYCAAQWDYTEEVKDENKAFFLAEKIIDKLDNKH